jgi:NNP family nitrate/nitrite transporter-like MFS transporter
MNQRNHLGLVGGLALALTVGAGIWLGSQGLRHFDPAVTGYALGTLLAAFAVGYRFVTWAQRPPSRMYFKRGLQLLFRRVGSTGHRPVPSGDSPDRTGEANSTSSAATAMRASPIPFGGSPTMAGGSSALPRGAGTLGHALATKFVTQGFIARRSPLRWVMHVCLSGGCTLAFAITFPLVFGWVHFESLPESAEIYRVKLFNLAVDEFSVHSAKAFVMFNLLNFSAVIVLVGLALAAWRRLTDAGERATQTFFEDILPLLLILVVTTTGLALTVSYKFLAGRGHMLWAVVHMVSVVALLLYIPFGKLFHMFQRICSLAVSLYKKSGEHGPRAHCRSCGEDFASQMHVDDLKIVLDQLGFDYRFATASGRLHYQDICPACRRRLLALNQGRSVGR